MGNISGRLSRPFKNWNVENRAHRVIAKEKPQAAPSYKYAKEQIEIVNKLEPNYKVESQKKNEQLDQHLKSVYVKSNDVESDNFNLIEDPDKPLPKERNVQPAFEYGFYESEKVTEGKVSLRQVLDFLSQHTEDPHNYTANYIAAKYKLKTKLVENILEYHRLFKMLDIDKKDNQFSLSMSPAIKSGVAIPYSIKRSEPKEITAEQKSDRQTEEVKEIKQV